jgi:hypothetical protein
VKWRKLLVTHYGSSRGYAPTPPGDVRLDPFFEALTGAPDPALDEDNIEALCRSLGEKVGATGSWGKVGGGGWVVLEWVADEGMRACFCSR